MKNKNNKTNIHHSRRHVSSHVRVERFFRHRTFLSVVLGFMILGLIKYESNLMGIMHQFYGQGFGFVSAYAHHDEVTRMPINYGVTTRHNDISGE